MRMVSCSTRYSAFYHRSGMLLRCLRLLRYILDACPATRPVGTTYNKEYIYNNRFYN